VGNGQGAIGLPTDGGSVTEDLTDFGRLLRQWRRGRRMSQLDLALGSGVSSRHISFIETGRSNPSREMVLTLSATLDLPLRQRNALLQTAGFAPIYSETELDDPQMADMLRALRLILRHHGPLGGAVAFDRHWELVMANEPYVRFMRLLMGERCPRMEPYVLTARPRPNLLRQLFDPEGHRRFVANWESVARSLLLRVQQEAAWSGDPATHELLQTLLAYPGVPQHWRETSFHGHPMVVPIELGLPGGLTARLFSTITTLGTPQDITLQELRIESFHAADEESECLVHAVLTGS
jgi:transcriptional regulator with XRE-family HTH domain